MPGGGHTGRAQASQRTRVRFAPFIFALCIALVLSGAIPVHAWANEEDFVVIESLMPPPTADHSWYRVPEEPRVVDTLVIHHASASGWFDETFQAEYGEQLKPLAQELGLTPQNLCEHLYDWRLVKAIFEAYGVSAHYLITRDGTIIRLVPEDWVAWHAGVSKMPSPDGREMVNTFSIGIELLSRHPDDAPEIANGSEPAYTEAQYASLLKLMAAIQGRWPIHYVVGHDEIAPERKQDPGPLFNWSRIRNEAFRPVVGTRP